MNVRVLCIDTGCRGLRMCVCIIVCMCLYLCMNVPVSAYVWAMHVCLYLCMYVQIYKYTYIHTYISYIGDARACMYIYICVYTNTHTHTHTCIHRAVLRAKRATLTQQALPIMAIPEPLLDVVARALLRLDLCLLRARKPSRMSPLVPRMRAQPAWTPQVKSARRSGQAVSPRAVR